MLTEERKRLILTRLKRDRRIIAKELSAEFGLSEDTIRRDLRELAADGLLTRVHGGALPASPTVVNLDKRRTLAMAEKTRLGQAAARLFTSGTSAFIDGGTTNLEMIKALPVDLSGNICTHSPTIAAALEQHSNIEVVIIGGRLFRHSMVATGAAAKEAIDRMRFEMFFLGVTGIHASEGLTTGDFEEAAIKRAITTRSAETIVLATAEKLGAVSPYRIVTTPGLTTLITTGDAVAAGLQNIIPKIVTV